MALNYSQAFNQGFGGFVDDPYIQQGIGSLFAPKPQQAMFSNNLLQGVSGMPALQQQMAQANSKPRLGVMGQFMGSPMSQPSMGNPMADQSYSPYSLSRSLGQIGNQQMGLNTNSPQYSPMQFNQPQFGMGGSPMMPSMPYYGFEQFFQGGQTPSAGFEPLQGVGKQQKDLEGWKWWADKGLGILGSLAPLAGGAVGSFFGGPVGGFGGNLAGRGISSLTNLGQQYLRG